MNGIRVPYSDAEKVRKELLDNNALVTTHKPIRLEKEIIFPVTEKYNVEATEEVTFEKYTQQKSFKDVVTSFLTDEQEEEFIHSFDTIGTIAIIQIPDLLVPIEEKIATTLLETNPHIETVRKRASHHHGKFRLQPTTYLAGKDEIVTEHTEFGVSFFVDVDNVYFSPRLSTERGRIRDIVNPSEDILVLFDGCGPYSLLLADKGANVTSVEWNPRGVELAKLSAAKNDTNINHVLGDVRTSIPPAEYDRIIMPAPNNALDYTDCVKPYMKPATTLHIYTFDEPSSIEEIKQALSAEYNTSNIEHVFCGQKSPGVFRLCFDINRT